MRFGFEVNVLVCNFLIVMYLRNGEVELFRKVFDLMKDRNLFFWNLIILCYIVFGYVDDVMVFLEEMERCGFKLDIVIWNFFLLG